MTPEAPSVTYRSAYPPWARRLYIMRRREAVASPSYSPEAAIPQRLLFREQAVALGQSLHMYAEHVQTRMVPTKLHSSGELDQSRTGELNDISEILSVRLTKQLPYSCSLVEHLWPVVVRALMHAYYHAADTKLAYGCKCKDKGIMLTHAALNLYRSWIAHKYVQPGQDGNNRHELPWRDICVDCGGASTHVLARYRRREQYPCPVCMGAAGPLPLPANCAACLGTGLVDYKPL